MLSAEVARRPKLNVKRSFKVFEPKAEKFEMFVLQFAVFLFFMLNGCSIDFGYISESSFASTKNFFKFFCIACIGNADKFFLSQFYFLKFRDQ